MALHPKKTKCMVIGSKLKVCGDKQLILRLVKAAVTCVRQNYGRLSVKKSLNKEIVGSITCTRLLSVNGQVSVSFRTVSDFLRMTDR